MDWFKKVNAMVALKELNKEEHFLPGNATCAGCGASIGIRLAFKALGPRTVFVVPACCTSVIQSAFPHSAFASPCLSFSNAFGYGYDDPRVNPTGGAIGLGHPIGASGVVYFGEMAHHLKRTGGKAGIQMMCGGGGIGIATVVDSG